MQYKIVVDKQSRTNPSSEKREYIVDIEELRCKGDIYDSLIITKDEDYVMRRLELTEYHVLNVLETPIKEPINDLNLELFEGDNYIYLIDMTGNKFYAEYLIKNEFTDMYVTSSEMNSAIEQTAKTIELSVSQNLTQYSTKIETEEAKQNAIDSSNNTTDEKLKNYSTTIEMNASIKIAADEISNTVSKTYSTKTETSAAKQEAIDSANSSTDEKLVNYSTTTEMNSAINQKADEINLSVNEKYITKTDSSTNISNAKQEAIDSANSSTDEKLEDYSTTEEMNAAITLESDNITSAVTRQFENVDKSMTTLSSRISQNTNSINLKVSKDNIISEINQTAEEVEIDTQKINFSGGYVEINSEGDNGTESGDVRFKLKKSDTEYAEATSNSYRIFADDYEAWLRYGWLRFKKKSTSEVTAITPGVIFVQNGTNSTQVAADYITTPTLNQTSLESIKKNIKKFENASDIVKNSDIYTYNLKSEKDTDKKHIGFVIGDKYNTPEEVISKNGDSIDLYSMVSVLWKTVKEQQEEITYLKEQIEKLKEVQND